MLGKGTLGSFPLGGEPFETAVLELPVRQASVAATGAPELLIRQFSVERGIIELPIRQESHHDRAILSLDIRQVSYAKGSSELPIRQTSLALPVGTGDAGDATSVLWRVIVLLDGIDVSASLTDAVRVDSSEGAARIAEFSMMPAIGAIDPTSWVRKAVFIDYAETDAAGVPNWQTRLFTGIVDVPEYDPSTRITLFRCTDRRQELFEQSAPQDVEIPGSYWSEHVFDKNGDGHQRAEDRLSTIAASFDIDAAGTAQLTDWAAKSTADYTYTDAGYIEGSRRLQLANSRDMHNRGVINFDFRFQRLRERTINRNWLMSPQLGCDYLQNTFVLPRRTMIEAAAETTGWSVQNIHFVDLPGPRYFECVPAGGGAKRLRAWGFKLVGPQVIPNPSAAAPFCQGAYITLSRRWAQTVTETYQIDVQAPQSIAQIGEIARQDSGGLTAEQETEEWETETDYVAPAVGGVLHRNGDNVIDADTGLTDGRAAMENALSTRQAIRRAAILASHRRNFVSWETLLQPQLKLSYTLSLDSTGLEAKGKVNGLVHQLSIATGAATTEVRLALSRSGATGALGDDPLDPPQAPDTQVEAVADDTPAFSAGGTGMHIGGTTTAQTFDEDWFGFVTNYEWNPMLLDRFSTDPDDPQTVIYPVQFRIQVPAIETDARQAVEATKRQTLYVDIPLDDLQIS